MKHVNESRIFLDGTWELTYAPDSVLQRDGYRDRRDDTLSTPHLCNRAALQNSGYDHISAQVPGNFELDLCRAGKCEDPFFGTNVLQMQQYECMHMYYARPFAFEGDPTGMVLEFEGIDTAAEVFLNGERILVCENMFLSHTVSVEDRLHTGENELVVHIKPATIYARRYGGDAMTYALHYNYESLALRKATGTFGWDILPRIVSGGLWRSVSLCHLPEDRIADVFGYTMRTDPVAQTARLCFRFETVLSGDYATEYALWVTGACGEHHFTCGGVLYHNEGQFVIDLENVKLWMPRNYGEPNLYDVQVRLMRGDAQMDEARFRLGIRTVALERTSVVESDGTPMGKGEFCFSVNGQRIFAMGTNWVPVDAFHSRDRERLPDILPMLNDLGCNMVRCWGGNVYEHEDFYDFCDENGILIWQDFSMACASYPQNAEFAQKLEEEAEQVVRKYRGHCSLLVWAGDNECDMFACLIGKNFKRDPNTNLLTRQVLPAVLKRLDLTRPYLPSSPYIDDIAYRTKLPVTEDHTWGPRDYFKGKYYRNTVCRFASEVGYHGCPDPDSLKAFLPANAIWPWRREAGTDVANDAWLAHAPCMELSGDAPYAYRIPLMATHVRTLFGKEPDELEVFAAESQISQAEADKYFIEKFRIARQWRTGILWWNLIDGWPQFSDAVVDYYGRKKLAYAYIRRSQQPLALMCNEPEKGNMDLYGVSDLQERVSVTWHARDLRDGVMVSSGTQELHPHTAQILCVLPALEDAPHFYLMEWEYQYRGQVIHGKNHYVSNMDQALNFSDYLSWMQLAGFQGDAFFCK